MSVLAVNPDTARELTRVLGGMARSWRDALASLVSREVSIQPIGLQVITADALAASLGEPHAVATYALQAADTGSLLLGMLGLPEAATLTGLMMMATDEAIAAKRTAAGLEPQDLEAMTDMARVLGSSAAALLGTAAPESGATLQDVRVLSGSEARTALPSGELVCMRFRLEVPGQPPGTGRLLVSRSAADRWNKRPIGLVSATPTPRPAGSSTPDEDEGIPAAAIRGVLNAFLASPDLLALVRRSCRRVGLELRRHNRTDIPNPAAHRGEVVLMDVPPGEERRFDWCRRIKEFANDVKVVLLLHRPSRARVVQGFMAEADVILGLPIDEPALSQKLTAILVSEPTT